MAPSTGRARLIHVAHQARHVRDEIDLKLPSDHGAVLSCFMGNLLEKVGPPKQGPFN
jgi:hypothetical protein